MRLIKDWKKSWRYYSQMGAFATLGVSLVAIADLGLGLLPYWESLIDAHYYAVVTAITGSLGYIGRVIQQGPNQ